MLVRNFHLIILIVIICSVIAGGLLITYIQKNDNPNFITTPKPKIVYNLNSALLTTN